LVIKFHFKSLKTKIVVWFSIVTTILLLLFSISFYYYFNQTIDISIQNDLSKTALYIEKKIEDNESLDNILKDEKIKHIEFAIIKNHNIVKKSSKFYLKNMNKYIDTNRSFYITDKGEYLKALFIIGFKQPFNGHIIVIQNNIDDKSENVLDSMLVLEPILLLLLIFIVIKALDKILIPIKNITQISKQISIENFSHTINLSSTDEYELKELINSFNDMIKRLQDGVENLDRFNSDVSHELKTPLTIIKGEIDIALKKQRDSQYYIKSLNSIKDEIINIQSIVDNLLLLTKYSKENISQTFVKCDLDSILLQAISSYNDISNQKNIKIVLEKFEPIEYIGNTQLLYTIFSNLLDNSIKYSSSNTTIIISLYKQDKIYFTVEDQGVGIPRDKIDKITEKFYRVDESRNKAIKGFGLGLSIVQNSVELHNGILEILSKPNQGTNINIIF